MFIMLKGQYQEQVGFSVLLKDTSTAGSGIEPGTLQSLDNHSTVFKFSRLQKVKNIGSSQLIDHFCPTMTINKL